MTNHVDVNLLNKMVAEKLNLDVEIDEDTGEVWHIINRNTSTAVPTLVSPTATPEYGTMAILYNPVQDWYQTGQLVEEHISKIEAVGDQWYAHANGRHQYHPDIQIAICLAVVSAP